MLAEGPMARHVKDLKLAYGILSGRDARDPISVDTPLYGPMPAEKRVALVTEIPGVALPDAIVESVKRAGEALSDSGWVVEQALPPELERVTELWGHVLSAEFQPVIEELAALMSEHAIAMLNKLFELYNPATFPAALVHAEKWRLCCAWSEFFERYPLVVGPTWTNIPFLHDADIAGDGAKLTVDMLRFITPGNVLGIPSVAVPTGVAAGLPTGVQVYADRWREDLCLEGAALIEHKVGRITPIDPTF
jgi:amidase